MTIREASQVSKHTPARRVVLRAVAAGATALAVPGAFSQTWPAKPIRLIVPFVAGGGADATARLIAGKMAERLGQQIFIDNKAGGNTIIGVQDLKRAAPDGHTLIWTMDQTFVLNPSLYNKLPYDPVKDFTPVALAITSPITVIGSTRPGDAQTIQEVVQRAKAQSGTLNIGSAAILAHIAQAEFSQLAGIEATRITYKGSAEVAQGLIAGDVIVVFDGLAPYVQFVKTGRARILAVTSSKRFGALPDVPTLDESGYKGMDLSVWFGFAGPAGMSSAIAQRLAQEAEWAVRQPDVIEKLGTFGFEPAAVISPAIMAERIVRDGQRYAPVIRKLGFKLD